MAGSNSVAEVVGPYTWGIIHQLVEEFPCAPCAEDGAKLMRFTHDIVNMKLGKPLFDAGNFVDHLNLIYEMVEVDGRLGTSYGSVESEVTKLFPINDGSLSMCLGGDRLELEVCTDEIRSLNRTNGCPTAGDGTPACPNPVNVCSSLVGCIPGK